MNIIDIEELARLVQGQLSASARSNLKVQLLGESGLQIQVDGQHCLSNIGVWPNGCCDLEHVLAESDLSQWQHLEFDSTGQAAVRVVREIEDALRRAQTPPRA